MFRELLLLRDYSLSHGSSGAIDRGEALTLCLSSNCFSACAMIFFICNITSETEAKKTFLASLIEFPQKDGSVHAKHRSPLHRDNASSSDPVNCQSFQEFRSKIDYLD